MLRRCRKQLSLSIRPDVVHDVDKANHVEASSRPVFINVAMFESKSLRTRQFGCDVLGDTDSCLISVETNCRLDTIETSQHGNQ